MRAITRVALPEIEDLVLTWADVSTAAQLERIAADFRTVRRSADGPDLQEPDHHRYSWRTRTHGDGTMTLTVRAPVEQCAELCAALDRRTEVAQDDDAEETRAREGGGRASVLINELVDVVAQAASDVPTDTSAVDRHTLVLYAPAEALAAEGPRRCASTMRTVGSEGWIVGCSDAWPARPGSCWAWSTATGRRRISDDAIGA